MLKRPNDLPISAASAPQEMSKNLGSRARSGLLHGRVSLQWLVGTAFMFRIQYHPHHDQNHEGQVAKLGSFDRECHYNLELAVAVVYIL